MSNKLIIMLSAKRCGSTAIFRIFQKNRCCKIANKNQKIKNWEIQYWNLASKALKGNDYKFRKRMKECIPNLQIPKNLNKKKIFNLWNQIHDKLGKTIFDKSPQYLSDIDALNLIFEYSLINKNVRVFCFIRNPLDAITSQYELWHNYTKEKNLKEREKKWINYYKNFEKIKTKLKVKFFQYEKFVLEPNIYCKELMNFCRIPYQKSDWSHIKPVSIGRFKSSLFMQVNKWKMSKLMLEHMHNYKYLDQQKLNSFSAKILFQSIVRYIPINIKTYLKNKLKWIK